jgi:hypothetical protein
LTAAALRLLLGARVIGDLASMLAQRANDASASRELRMVQTQLSFQPSGPDERGGGRKLGFDKPTAAIEQNARRINTQLQIDTFSSQTTAITWPPSDEDIDMDACREHHTTRRPIPTSSSSFKSSTALAIAASETKAILSWVLKVRPDAPAIGRLYSSIHGLHQRHNPRLPPAIVRVL